MYTKLCVVPCSGTKRKPVWQSQDDESEEESGSDFELGDDSEDEVQPLVKKRRVSEDNSGAKDQDLEEEEEKQPSPKKPTPHKKDKKSKAVRQPSPSPEKVAVSKRQKAERDGEKTKGNKDGGKGGIEGSPLKADQADADPVTKVADVEKLQIHQASNKCKEVSPSKPVQKDNTEPSVEDEMDIDEPADEEVDHKKIEDGVGEDHESDQEEKPSKKKARKLTIDDSDEED